MRMTNENNLPPRVIRQLPEVYRPTEKRISVTDLKDSPRIRTLTLQFWDDIVMDYSELLDTIFGISIHHRQEVLVADDEEAETKFEDVIDGTTLVGKSDNYDTVEKIIRDTKVIPVDRLNFPDFFDDLEKQLNVYAYQRSRRNQEVLAVEADFYFRDWKRIEAKKAVPKWAVMRKGQKKAQRLLDTEEEAYGWIMDHSWKTSDLYVEYRPPKDYPKLPVQWSVPIKLWTSKEQKGFVRENIEYHTLAPLDCPQENRWRNNVRCTDFCRARTVCQYSPKYLGKK